MEPLTCASLLNKCFELVKDDHAEDQEMQDLIICQTHLFKLYDEEVLQTTFLPSFSKNEQMITFKNQLNLSATHSDKTCKDEL